LQSAKSSALKITHGHTWVPVYRHEGYAALNLETKSRYFLKTIQANGEDGGVGREAFNIESSHTYLGQCEHMRTSFTWKSRLMGCYNTGCYV